MKLSEDTLPAIRQADLKTLVSLDKQGFLVGEKEDGSAYAERLKTFLDKLNELETEAKETGKLEIEGETFDEKERIPVKLYSEARKLNEELYSFQIDWVPGYFVTPQFGLLFGGCAYLFEPEFFSLFIIRNSFKTKKKWFLYSRQELMGHELCHVARFAMNAHKYEEHFAYQTAPKKFRKTCGSIVRSEWETYTFLGLCFGLLIAQLVQLFAFGITVYNTPIFKVPSFYIGLSFILFFAYMATRQVLLNRSFRLAQEHLSRFSDKARAIAFRCSDKELDQIAKDKNLDITKLEAIIESPLRFSVIKERFCK